MNHSIKKILFVVCPLILLSYSTKAEGLIPLNEEEYDFLYTTFERTETRSTDYFNYQLAPYHLDDQRFDPGPLNFLRPPNNGRINFFVFGKENYTAREHQHSNGLENLRGGFTVAPFDNISVYTGFSLDEAKAKDENYTGKKWRGLAGGVDQSFFNYHEAKIDITVGRFASYWGIQRSLVLSGTNNLDGFGYTVNWRKLSLSYRLAKLDRLTGLTDSLIFENRYFAGHRLDIHVNKQFRIGVFETIIFGGEGRTVEFNYLNPILFYHSDQLNDNVNDNTFVGFDFTYLPKQGIKLYGQLLIDDYQIEKKTQGDQEPNEYGIIAGAYFTDLYPSVDVRTEYVKVTNRTYNQKLDRNRYVYKNHSIGYFDKNDFDKASLDIFYWINSFTRSGISYSYYRQGEGTINDPWSEPWMDSTGDYSEPFPTGVVEKTHEISGFLQGFFIKHLYVYGKFGYRSIKNDNNLEYFNSSNLFFQMTVSTFLSIGI